MITYDFLIDDVCKKIPEVRKMYNIELEKNNMESDSGVHIFFSICFVPVLKNAILKKDDNLSKKMFDYL